jgi:hypothetical protein
MHAAERLHLAEWSLAETGGKVALAPHDVRRIATKLGTRRRENPDNDVAYGKAAPIAKPSTTNR